MSTKGYEAPAGIPAIFVYGPDDLPKEDISFNLVRLTTVYLDHYNQCPVAYRLNIDLFFTVVEIVNGIPIHDTRYVRLYTVIILCGQTGIAGTVHEVLQKQGKTCKRTALLVGKDFDDGAIVASELESLGYSVDVNPRIPGLTCW